MEAKFVTQDRYTKKYKLGPGIFRVGSSYLKIKNLHKDIINIIDSVAEKTRESVGYYVKDENVIISLYEMELFQENRLGDRPGLVYPVNAGSVGKCLTAFSKPEEIDEVLARSQLKQYTPYTLVDQDLLKKEYEKIRSQGYATSEGDKLEGQYGIAVPIRDSADRVFACMAVACFKTGLTEEKKNYMKDVLLEGAKEIADLIP